MKRFLLYSFPSQYLTGRRIVTSLSCPSAIVHDTVTVLWQAVLICQLLFSWVLTQSFLQHLRDGFFFFVGVRFNRQFWSLNELKPGISCRFPFYPHYIVILVLSTVITKSALLSSTKKRLHLLNLVDLACETDFGMLHETLAQASSPLLFCGKVNLQLHLWWNFCFC